MTHCIICGQRLWFEKWRSFNKYSWCHETDSQPDKPQAYLYKLSDDGVIKYYASAATPRRKELWYHIKCIKEKGKPTNNPLADQWKMKEERL